MNVQDKPLTFSYHYIRKLNDLINLSGSFINTLKQKNSYKKKQKTFSLPTQELLNKETNKGDKQNCSFSFHNYPQMMLYPACNSTTIMQIFQWGDYDEYEYDIYYDSTKNFIHFNKQGEILDLIRIDKQELPFRLKMLNQKLAVVLSYRPQYPQYYQIVWESQYRNPEVILWNFETNLKISIDDIGCSKHYIPKIYNYESSSLFCICIPDSYYRLKYYEYSNRKKNKSDKIHQFQYVKGSKNNAFFDMPFQLDNISKLALVRADCKTGRVYQKFLQFRTYQFNPNNLKGSCNQYCFEFDVQIIEAITQKNYSIFISDLWLVRKHIFYITLYLGFEKFNEDLYKNQMIVWKQYSYLWNSNSNTVRKLTCQIPQNFYNVQFTHSLRELTNFKINITSEELDPVLENKANINFQQIDLPVYFISCFKQKQIIVGKFQSKNQSVPMQFYRNLAVCYEGSQEGVKVTQILIKNQEYEQAEIMVFLCLQLIENCDEALLQQVYNLINQ